MEGGYDTAYKGLEAILEQDVRSKNIGLVSPYDYGSLESWHAYVDLVCLNESAPDELKRNFNRAKNLSLYAWFVYDFHQVAEMDAISTLEMALKTRFEQESKKIPRGLKNLYNRAVEQGWIREQRGNDVRILADYRNDLAHGTTMLHDQSVRTLEVCAMYINQLYPIKNEVSDDER
jgi:hypothetical protein